MPLAFALPADSADLSQALTDLLPQLPQLPKPHRALIEQAAQELKTRRETASECAEMLELAASLKAGQMDSQARHDEIAGQVRGTLTDVAARLRA